jgi:hypothetical protein
VVSALSLAGLWLVLFVVSGSKDPGWTGANIVKFAMPGIVFYPACWYVTIFRRRDYALGRTMVLVVATFATVGIVVNAIMMIGGFYAAITILRDTGPRWQVLPIIVLGPLAYALATLIGAIILIVPYLVVATPMALAHRWLLLEIHAPAAR